MAVARDSRETFIRRRKITATGVRVTETLRYRLIIYHTSVIITQSARKHLDDYSILRRTVLGPHLFCISLVIPESRPKRYHIRLANMHHVSTIVCIYGCDEIKLSSTGQLRI